MVHYGILNFTKNEKIGKSGITFTCFDDRSIHVVNTKSKSKIDRWAKVSDDFQLLEIMGPIGSYQTESNILHYIYGIKPAKYPSYTMKIETLDPHDKDTRIHDVFSIDNPGTRDIDDAISMEITGNAITLGIHITDVAHTLLSQLNNPDDIIEFARRRSSSTYTDLENTTMLPPKLTYDVLSLSTNKIRKTISLWLEYVDGKMVRFRFESAYVKNVAAMQYSQFIHKFPCEYEALSALSSQSNPHDIVAWTMMTYNKLFAHSNDHILLRNKSKDVFAEYSPAHLKLKHDDIGALYTHATSPIRRFADLYNQIIWHGYDTAGELDIDELNKASINIKRFQYKHAVLDLSYSCRSQPRNVSIQQSTTGTDFVRVMCDDRIYTVPRYDSYYDGEMTIGDCYIWGVLKNGVSTLRLATESSELSTSAVNERSRSIAIPFQELSNELSKQYVEDILQHPLDHFQSQCYEVVKSGQDLMFLAPTGSGKTAVAMTAICKAFINGKRAIYTSPIKSLSNEKYADFRKRLDGRVSLLTGDSKSRCSPPGGDGQSELIIMTAEILRNKLCSDKDDDLIDVEVVVIDECHYINDYERGCVWEETLMFLPKNVQVIALSATLDKPEEFCKWLNIRRPTQIVQRFDRHVPLFFGSIVHQKNNDDKLTLMNERDSKTYTWNKPTVDQSFAKLGSSLINLELCPAIVFCMSRKRCVRNADSITDNLILGTRPHKPKPGASEEEQSAYEIILAEHNEIVVDYKRKFDAIHAKYLGKYRKQLQTIPGYDSFLSQLQKGVAYHHSAMIPILREFVEILFREKLIMVVFATETLACGIDMPARSVVFTELEKPCGESNKRLLHTEEFIQMAGRAGRRGRDTKGYVIYYSVRNEKIPYSTFHSLVLGRPPKATSQLRISPDLVLRNLFNGYDSMRLSLLFAELKVEENQASNSYDSLQNKLEDDDLDSIIELDNKLSGIGFIRLNPKQTKNAKNDLMKLLKGMTVEDARAQSRIRDQLSGCKYAINDMWNEALLSLLSADFIDNDYRMMRKGMIASKMCDGLPLVRAEILDSTLCDTLIDVKTLISWLSIFAESANFDDITLTIPDDLITMIEESKFYAEKYYEKSINCNVSYLMYDWLTHKDVRRIFQFLPLSDFGTFVKVILRVSTFVEETMNVFLGLELFEQYNQLENYQEILFDGIVGNGSIHV